MRLGPVQISDNRRDRAAESLIVPANRAGSGEFAVELRLEDLIVIADADEAYPFRGSRSQKPPQRRFGDGEVDLGTKSALAICCRRHAQLGRRTLVNAARAAITGIEGSSGHAFALLQPILKTSHPMRVCVLARRHAHDLFEQALEMPWAHSAMCAEICQRDHAFADFAARLDVAAGALDHGN